MKLSGTSGFTLIEIMIAVTVTSLLLATVYGIFSSVSGAREKVLERAEGYHRARVIFDRIGREVRSAYAKPGSNRTAFTGGENRDGNPFLQLTTTAVTPQSGVLTGLAQVAYQLVEDPDDPENRVLLRSERPLLVGDREEVSEYPLAEKLSDFGLRFYAEGEWQEEWQSGLPQMVEITLAMVLDGRETIFTSTFEVAPVAGPLP